MQLEREVREEGEEFCINDNADILTEVLKRLDGASLGAAACVCRLWLAASKSDALWEHLCFRNAPPKPMRALVSALGGYRRLYMLCVRPILSRLGSDRRAWTTCDEVQLSLSLFCVDYYERLGLSASASPSSLMFLCKPVNV